MENTIAVFTDDQSPDKYFHLGLTLGLKLTIIQKIEADYCMCGRQLIEIIQA